MDHLLRPNKNHQSNQKSNDAPLIIAKREFSLAIITQW